MEQKKEEKKTTKQLFFTKENYFKIKKSIFEKNTQENDFLVKFFGGAKNG